MLAPQEAARRAGVSQRTVYRWVEDGRIHFAETTDGGLFVCLAPLLI
jgi:excisionase family DNA binding protein